MTATVIGQPVGRVDGRQKVTGAATYAAEFDVPGQAHGAIVRSTAPSGRLASIDSTTTERAPGVLVVLTPRNAPRLAYRQHKAAVDPEVGERLHVLQDDRVIHQGQPIALVVADTLEQAVYASTLVRAVYEEEAAITDIAGVRPVLPTRLESDQGQRRPSETRRGDAEAALASADVKVDETYVIPRENHNPIEMHATIAAWDGDNLTLWDKTQWVDNVADEIAAVFGIPAENIRVISPFVGGAFGSGLRAWPHVTLAALGARVAGRPVKVMLSRREMYYGVGYRPHTVQRVALGASRDGRLSAIVHDAYQETSTYEEYTEALLNATRFLHSCPNVYTRHRLAPMNVHTPTWMRAPGEASGMFALECAMDELAAALNIDPVELRLRNEPEQDEFKKLPFSSRSTRECYRDCRRTLRLEPAGPRAALDARRALADRLGHGERHLPNEFRARVSDRASPAGRYGGSGERGERHGAGHLDLNDAGGGRCSRPSDRPGEVQSRRQPAAENASAWRVDDDGERRQRRAGCLPQGARGCAWPRRGERPCGGDGRIGQPIEASAESSLATPASASPCTLSGPCSWKSPSIPISARRVCGASSAPTAPAASSTRRPPAARASAA